MERGSIFASHDAFEERLIIDQDKLQVKIQALKTLGLKIVLTSGSFDLMHIGHMRYLREARKLGHCLVVGVDSDEKIRAKKGEYKPVIPEMERAEMVAHSRYADIITIKPKESERWGLIKLVRPDVLVASKRNEHNPENERALAEFCGELVVFESQATTSTSAQIRRLQRETLIPCLTQIRDSADKMIEDMKGG
jgi:D-beta-D-heptose 7-phosphate kinase/D-beta-D-heptose 1-phosphate adenosyltransferase